MNSADSFNNNLNLYIPRASLRTTKEEVRDIFFKAQIGIVDYSDLVIIKDKETKQPLYMSVFIKLDAWNPLSEARSDFEKNGSLKLSIGLSTTELWIILPNKNPLPRTIAEFIELNNSELEKIQNRGIKSRIKSECNELYKDYHNVLIGIDGNKITINAIEFLHTNKNSIKMRVYKFILGSHYPFRPPEIYLNNYPYSTILQMKGDYEKNMIKKIKGKDCLCCHSINCNANWSPAIRLCRIIDEIKETINLKKDIINLLLVEKIKKQYNMPYAYIESYLV